MYIFTYMYIYENIYTCINVCAFMFLYTYLRTYTCVYAPICRYICREGACDVGAARGGWVRARVRPGGVGAQSKGRGWDHTS